MKRTIAAALAIAALVGIGPPAHAGTYYGFTIGISNAPPPPRVIFRERPRVVMVPETRVYVIDDSYPDPGYDMFQSGNYWYVVDDGYWYRARSYGGPYRVVDVRYVPRPLLMVPERRWRHHPHGGPPGQMKKMRYDRGDYDRGGDYGRGKGKGNGKGHGHDH
jgi:hypothetical protein